MAKRTCSIEGCDRKGKVTRGWCQKHYKRWLRHGDPLTKQRQIEGGGPASLKEYFDSHAKENTERCIVWPFGKTGGGYGMVDTGSGVRGVHVLACENAHGPAPKGTHACHSCHTPACFNPRHLRWGTPAENSADRREDGTDLRGESNPSSKLSEDEVREIRNRYGAGGLTHRQLGVEYGVAVSTIGRIVRRTKWIHVD